MPARSASLRSAIRARNRAFEKNDLAWATEMMPGATSPMVVEMAFHKARYICTAVSDKRRLESQKYLADNGLTDAAGRPVSIGDPLDRE